jgi:PAS domain S-box-containing protein
MVPEWQLVQQSLDMLEDVFYVYDEQGRLVVWNERLNELFDCTDEELADMTPPSFFVEADRPAVERAVADVFESGKTVVEARAETTDGTIRFELTGHRLTDDDGHVIGFCGVGRDVTERREQERALAAQNDRLNNFATILAHDVRNPLSVARAYVALSLANGETTNLDDIATALDRIERMVDDILTVAVEEQGTLDRRPVDIAAVATEAWESVDGEAAELDVRATGRLDADRGRLLRLFENLFRNAVEHSGESVTVTVTETASGFAVADDGPGIPPAEREQVFSPGVSTTDGGTGFGLYIVQTIAEAHGWSVALADGDGGARFEFDLHPDEGFDLAL